jgi:hypothetical protein
MHRLFRIEFFPPPSDPTLPKPADRTVEHPAIRICDCPGAALQTWRDLPNKLLVASSDNQVTQLQLKGHAVAMRGE